MGENKKKYKSKTLYNLLYEIAENAAHDKKKATRYHLFYAYMVVVNMSMEELTEIFGKNRDVLEKIEYTIQRLKFMMSDKDLRVEVNPQLLEKILPFYFEDLEKRTAYSGDLRNFKGTYELHFMNPDKGIDQDVFNTFIMLIRGWEEGGKKVLPSILDYYLRNMVLSLRSVPDGGEKEKKSIFDAIAASKKMEEALCKKVVGQDAAIQTFVSQYVQSKLIGSAPNKPKATFLFAGPPGVGKTFLSQGVADELGIPYKRFDMSEYGGASRDSVQGLIGFERTWKDAAPGVLTTFVADNPTCILLFDEIEKACDQVLKVFLQILDGARLTDKYMNQTVSFKDAILIFTTNAARDIYEDNYSDLTAIPTNSIINALREDESFPKELISRFASGNIVMFNNLHTRHLMELTMGSFRDVASAIRREHGLDLRYNRNLAELFMLHQAGKMDARMVSSQSRKFMTDAIHAFVRNEVNEDSTLKQIKFELLVDEKNKEMYDIFNLTEEFRILFISDKDNKAYSFDKTSIKTAMVEMTDTKEDMEELLKYNKYQMIVVDLAAGMSKAAENKKLMYASSEGNKCRSVLSKLAVDIPIYVLDDDTFTPEERVTLQREGARGCLPAISAGDDGAAKKEWERVVNEIHFQNKLSELQNTDKIVSFQTEMKTEKNAGVIKFCDMYVEEVDLESAADRKNDKENLISDVERPKERFKDIIGAKNAIADLRYFIDYVKNPEKYELMGCGTPKGVLLYGPPGTGKTMLAKATAGESGISFIPTTATELSKKSTDAINKVFATARRHAPAIIFIDEIDAIGLERLEGSNVYLNTLLTEMDGFHGRGKKPVFVIAATNFDVDGTKSGKFVKLDPALSRRFSRKIYVDLPSRVERKQYIEMMLEKKGHRKYVADGAIESFANLMAGGSCAELENVIEFALSRCAMSGNTRLNGTFLLECVNEYVYGEKREKRNKEAYKTTAYHEAGHAFVMWKEGEIPSFMTIVSRGNYGGYVMPKEDSKGTYTEEDLRRKIRISLAGRAAEMVYYEKNGEDNKQGINTGASQDLETATRHAKAIVSWFGMQEDQLVVVPRAQMPEAMVFDMLKKANDILKEELEKTKKMIGDNFEAVERLAQGAIAYTQLSESQILTLLEGEGLPEEESTPEREAASEKEVTLEREVVPAKKETKPKKFYVVNAGYHPGIYESWPECQRQIYKYSGASYKGYKSLEEALKGFIYKYYVIKDGDNIGIYDDWKKYMEVLKSEKAPVCAIFKNREAAEQYLNAPLEVYYVVKRGKKPGIYRTWAECKKALGDAEDTIYKKFDTEVEAQEFLNNN